MNGMTKLGLSAGTQLPPGFADASRRRPFKAYMIIHDELLRTRMISVLNDADVELTAYWTCLEFCLDQKLHSPGVAFVEERIPGMAADELLKQLKERSSPLSVVIIGSKNRIPQSVGLLRKGAHDFILRSFVDSEIVASFSRAYCIHYQISPGELCESDEEIRRGISSLTDRERQVLQLSLSGCSSAVIARTLDIRLKTVEAHRSNINNKMRARDIAHLIRMCNQIERQHRDSP
jgi:FixJ family two-component response regulator